MHRAPEGLSALDAAEWERLHRTLNEGPGRRIQEDALQGRPASRVDERHVQRLRGLMRALEEGRT